MRLSGSLGWLVIYAVCGGVTVGAVGASPAAAQARTAAIRVHATVRDVTEADLLGAHAVTAPAPSASAGAARAAEHWRITSGRSASVGIRLEGVEAVTICEESAGRLAGCAPYLTPRVETTTDGALPRLVVRVGPSGGARARGASVAPARLTLAFIDF